MFLNPKHLHSIAAAKAEIVHWTFCFPNNSELAFLLFLKRVLSLSFEQVSITPCLDSFSTQRPGRSFKQHLIDFQNLFLREHVSKVVLKCTYENPFLSSPLLHAFYLEHFICHIFLRRKTAIPFVHLQTEPSYLEKISYPDSVQFPSYSIIISQANSNQQLLHPDPDP